MPARLLLALAFLHPLPGSLRALARLPFFFRMAALGLLPRILLVPAAFLYPVLLLVLALFIVLEMLLLPLIFMALLLLRRFLAAASEIHGASEALAELLRFSPLVGLLGLEAVTLSVLLLVKLVLLLLKLAAGLLLQGLRIRVVQLGDTLYFGVFLGHGARPGKSLA